MSRSGHSGSFPSPDHDHQRCLTGIVARAETAFAGHGMRLTPLRRQVLEEVAGSHQALGAYEVLERMASKAGRRMAPISIYRALDCLVDVGIVHRLESRNAFFACQGEHPGDRRQIVLSCKQCGLVAEVDGADVFDGIGKAATVASFRPE
ncbi:MAG: transcriptional repressor, partial [Proteobacteria bacterium]|nr:transcriptional repressor [Pseudomonadota bacterium]